MPRTWGYIIIVAAVIVGAASLLMPVPETVEVAPPEPPKSVVRPPTAPAPQRTRPSRQAEPPAREQKPPARTVPMQDTTKTRQLIQPKPAG